MATYPDLSRVSDPALRTAIKHYVDRLNAQELRRRGVATQAIPTLTGTFDFGSQRLRQLADAASDTDGVTVQQVIAEVNQAFALAKGLITTTHSPIPPPPPTNPPGTYDNTLPWDPPHVRDFLRGDAWGVPVPGLPFHPSSVGSGGSSEHPERLLTGLDYAYDRTLFWPQMLAAHQSRGYTHWLRWWPNARDDGGNSIAQFVDDCLRVKTVIPYVIVSLGSKVFDPRDQTVSQWQARVGPVIDALLAANACDEFIPAFEIDSFNVPGEPTIQYCKWVGQQAHAAGKSCWLHFFPEHTSWFDDSRGRFGFWDDLGTDVDGICYQTDPAWDVPMMQARIVDTLSQFGRQGNVHKFRLMEDQATYQFTRNDIDENVGSLRGYYACCTIDNVSHTDAKVWGAGNGLKRPDGSRV